MFKKLGKKVLPIIMASMLVTSMAAVSVSAVEEATEGTPAVTDTAVSFVWVDPESGVKLESESLKITENDAFVSCFSAEDFPMVSSIMEKSFDITVFGKKYDEVTGSYANFDVYPVTAYLPCANEGRYVAYLNAETQEATQVEAEYVDGAYKIQLVGQGTYVICDYPIAEGEGEMQEQTFVDEVTGISVTGMVQSDSKLLVIDVVQLIEDLLAELQDMGATIEGAEDQDAAMQEVFDILNRFDGYLVCPIRNFNIAKTEGELTVSLPSEFGDYEVRHLNIFSEDILNGDFSAFEGYEDILSEEAFNTKTNEQIADDVNALIDTLLVRLTAEYIDGNYVVNSEGLGLFMVAEENSFKVTADDIQMLREELEEVEPEQPTDAPTGGVIDTDTQTPTQPSTQAPTQAPTQSSTQAPTQAPATQQGKVVDTSDSKNVPAILMILGLATAAITTLRKKGLVK